MNNIARMVRYRQSERVASRVIDGSAYVVGVDQQRIMELNEVATFIWETLVAPRSLDDLTRAIVDEFDVERQIAERDAERFVRSMVERGVVLVQEETR